MSGLKTKIYLPQFVFRTKANKKGLASRGLFFLFILIIGIGIYHVSVANQEIEPCCTLPDLAQRLDTIQLPKGSTQFSLTSQSKWFGMTIAIRVFETSASIENLIKHLSIQQPILRDLFVSPGSVVLSGQNEDIQWVAKMWNIGDNHVQGTLSALTFPKKNQTFPQTVHADWLPAQAKLIFDWVTPKSEGAGSQQLWTHPDQPKFLAPLLYTALESRGWRASAEIKSKPHRFGVPELSNTPTFSDLSDISGTPSLLINSSKNFNEQIQKKLGQIWVRGNARLQLNLLAIESGSGIMVYQRIDQ